MRNQISLCTAAALGAAFLAASATAADFYKGKQLTLIVAAGAGGGYGAVGQIVSRHFPRFLAGKPTMVPQYMPKAGGVVAANYLYNVASANGTVIGLVRNASAFGQAMGSPGIKYDVTKWHWIGSTGPLINVLAARKDSPVNTLAGLKKTELVVGGTGRLGTLFTFPTTLSQLLGYKTKVVLGYRGTSDVRGALDRNEVQGMVQPWPNWLRSHFHKQKSVNYLVQFGFDRLPDLPDIPTLIDLSRNDDERKMTRLVTSPAVTGRPFAAPPKTPKARVEELRAAFSAMVKDAGYQADMKKRKRMMGPLSGAAMEKLTAEIMSTPKPLVDKVRLILGYNK
jgi:tripartite-type tricarboxylate transporter receptor subunit TctC